MMLTPGESFGSYKVIREVGRGAMGAVFEAEHVGLRKRVAIKVLLPEAAGDGAATVRFLREGEAAARIRHDHIVDVSDVGTRDGTAYLVMEYLDGESLADALTRKRRFRDDELADLMIPVCDALAMAHESGVIHRDVKPENIFLARTARGGTRAMLVDFGISHVTHHDPKLVRLTSSAVLIGTPCYLSPEAARSARNVDARSDQYSLGATLYECRTGLLPYERASIFEMITAILMEDPPLPSDRAPDVDPRLEAAIMRAMSRAPDDRFPDMRELALALLPLASEAVRARWEPELRGHLAARRTPVGAVDRAPRRAAPTALELDTVDDARAGLAPTDPGELAPVDPNRATMRQDGPTPEPVVVDASSSDTPSRPAPRARSGAVVAALVGIAAIVATMLGTGRRPVAVHAATHGPATRVVETEPAPVAVVPVAVAAVVTAPVVTAPVERHRRGAARAPRHAAVAVASPSPAPPAAPSPAPPAAPSAPRSLLRTDFGGTTP